MDAQVLPASWEGPVLAVMGEEAAEGWGQGSGRSAALHASQPVQGHLHWHQKKENGS